jgi:hypothetical protein
VPVVFHKVAPRFLHAPIEFGARKITLIPSLFVCARPCIIIRENRLLTRCELCHVGLLVQLALLCGPKGGWRELLLGTLPDSWIDQCRRHLRWHGVGHLHPEYPALEHRWEAATSPATVGIFVGQGGIRGA